MHAELDMPIESASSSWYVVAIGGRTTGKSDGILPLVGLKL